MSRGCLHPNNKTTETINASINSYTKGHWFIIRVHVPNSIWPFSAVLLMPKMLCSKPWGSITSIICGIVSCCTTNPIWITQICNQRYPCISPLCCSSWYTKAINSSKSVCSFLLNKSSSRQSPDAYDNVVILSQNQSISLLLNPIEKYDSIRCSIVGIVHGNLNMHSNEFPWLKEKLFSHNKFSTQTCHFFWFETLMLKSFFFFSQLF